MPREKWNDIIAINLTSFFDTMRLLLPHMKERGYGRVINTASVHGLVASAAKAPYVSAKHGVIGLTKVAALEYAAVGNRETGGVTINAICPGWVETALIEPQIQAKVDLHNGDRAKGIADLLSEKQPSRRMSTPEEIGAIAGFLMFTCSSQHHRRCNSRRWWLEPHNRFKKYCNEKRGQIYLAPLFTTLDLQKAMY